jgi:predicted HTH domain antitoxin
LGRSIKTITAELRERRRASFRDQCQEIEMATVRVEVPDRAFSALGCSPEELSREMRIAAAILWYHQTLISQGKAAEIAGLSRADFLDARALCL